MQVVVIISVLRRAALAALLDAPLAAYRYLAARLSLHSLLCVSPRSDDQTDEVVGGVLSQGDE